MIIQTVTAQEPTHQPWSAKLQLHSLHYTQLPPRHLSRSKGQQLLLLYYETFLDRLQHSQHLHMDVI